MGDLVREINQQVEAVRGIADPEDRLKMQKELLASMLLFMCIFSEH